MSTSSQLPGIVNILVGTSGAEVLIGRAYSDCIVGGEGSDSLEGGFGDDTLLGGGGNDSIIDFQGDNRIDGGSGEDSVIVLSQTGSECIVGGEGSDRIVALGKRLVLEGGDGSDAILATGYNGNNASPQWVDRGAVTIRGGDGDDKDWAQVQVLGTSYYPTGLSARYFADVLIQGDAGNDYLQARYIQRARLEGGSGNDTVEGYVEFQNSNWAGSLLGIGWLLGRDELVGSVATDGTYEVDNLGIGRSVRCEEYCIVEAIERPRLF